MRAILPVPPEMHTRNLNPRLRLVYFSPPAKAVVARPKPGSVIERVSTRGAYFFITLPISLALPMTTNTKLSRGKYRWITRFASASVIASICA